MIGTQAGFLIFSHWKRGSCGGVSWPSSHRRFISYCGQVLTVTSGHRLRMTIASKRRRGLLG